MKFIDDDGSIIVPRSVRPIIDAPPTVLGNKCGALKQFRVGKLHIRDYGSYYSVHSDKVDPLLDPLGHLIVDAPEYLVGMLSGISIYTALKDRVVNCSKPSTDSSPLSEFGGKVGLSPVLAGLFATYAGYSLTKSLRKLAQG